MQFLERLFKKEVFAYGGGYPNQEKSCFCSMCTEYHSIPNNDLVLYRGFLGIYKLACAASMENFIKTGGETYVQEKTEDGIPENE